MLRSGSLNIQPKAALWSEKNNEELEDVYGNFKVEI